MTPTLLAASSEPIHAQARLETKAITGRFSVRRRAELCGEHLAATVQALAAWARDRELEGKVIVLAIDRPVPGLPFSVTVPDDRVRCGFAFGTILLHP